MDERLRRAIVAAAAALHEQKPYEKQIEIAITTYLSEDEVYVIRRGVRGSLMAYGNYGADYLGVLVLLNLEGTDE